MNALRLMNVLALLLILLPWRAQACGGGRLRCRQSQPAGAAVEASGRQRRGRDRSAAAGVDHREPVMDDGKHAFRTRAGADYSHWALSPRRRAKPDRSV